MLRARLQTLPDYTHQHRHEHHQAVVGVLGGAEVSVDGREGRLDTWRACMVPAGVRHEYRGNRDNRVLVIDVDAWHPGATSAGFREFQVVEKLFHRPRVLELDSHLQQLVQLSAREIRRASADHGIHNHLASAIMLALAERQSQISRPHPQRAGLEPTTMRRYVLENLNRRITVEELAGIACLSPSRFHEVFRAAMDTSPHQFLLNTRLDQACQLIRTTAMTISEISGRTGFSSQGALTTALKKHRGVTPTGLRQRQ